MRRSDARNTKARDGTNPHSEGCSCLKFLFQRFHSHNVGDDEAAVEKQCWGKVIVRVVASMNDILYFTYTHKKISESAILGVACCWRAIGITSAEYGYGRSLHFAPHRRVLEFLDRTGVDECAYMPQVVGLTTSYSDPAAARRHS